MITSFGDNFRTVSRQFPEYCFPFLIISRTASKIDFSGNCIVAENAAKEPKIRQVDSPILVMR